MKNALLKSQNSPATAMLETPYAKAENLLAALHTLEEDALPLRAQLAEIEMKKEEAKAMLQEWTEKHKDLFTSKMMSLDGGTFGYRLGVKSVVFPDDAPADIQDKYLKIVKEEAPSAIIEKVDSKSVVHAWGLMPALRKRLEKLKLSIRQPENFTVSLKKQSSHE